MQILVRLFVVTCLVCLCGWGQDTHTQIPESYIALMQSDIQTKKAHIIERSLALSDDQAKNFWPLQRSYESDLSKLGDQRLAIIRDLAKDWDTLSDANAKDLGKRLLKYHRRRVDLQSRYFNRISKEMSPMIAAKFFQIELQLEDIIDLGVASSVPLIQQASDQSR